MEKLLPSIAAIAGTLITAFGVLYQWHQLRFRTRLKTDLEILKLYKESCGEDKNYDSLKAGIEAAVVREYSSPKQSGFQKERIPDLLVGVSFLGGAILWIIFSPSGFDWWRVGFAVFLAFIGIGGLLNAFNVELSK